MTDIKKRLGIPPADKLKLALREKLGVDDVDYMVEILEFLYTAKFEAYSKGLADGLKQGYIK